MENIMQDSQFSSQDTNWAPLQHNSEELPFQSTCSAPACKNAVVRHVLCKSYCNLDKREFITEHVDFKRVMDSSYD